MEKSQFPFIFAKHHTLIQQLVERPSWFLDIQSPYAIYASCSASESAKVEFLVNEYSTAFVQDYLFEQQLTHFEVAKDHDLVANYKRHHVEHSPAKSIIKGENEAWLSLFLENNHFKTI